MSQTMLALGDFRFAVDTAAYQTLQRTSAYRWPGQERLAREPALQFTGPGTETLTLDGVIYPAFRGGLGQLDAMREMAARGEPLLLVDGLGQVRGQWVITQIEESQSHFLPKGIPRKMTFTLSLQRYGEDT
ncbi:MAG: tail protein (plasmid) [Candidatus Entotheonella factor]|uniref:Tail protein n=1 Tax=Entotheonella factor TaxID=1429438 RepID=W4M072_ENTF1|nr:MAG: tail protein [Candidatus Entotheonella factor]